MSKLFSTYKILPLHYNYPTFQRQRIRMKKILSFLLIVIFTPLVIMAQTTSQKTTPEPITISFMQAFADAFNAHDVNAILSFMSDDCVFMASAGPDAVGEKFTGKEAVKKAFEDVFNTFPNAHWGNVTHFLAGDRGVTEWLFTGTKADGSRVEVTGCDVFTFRNGKIILKNSYRKNRPAIPK